jgi:tetratricopeptide (TPR) repeat protein
MGRLAEFEAILESRSGSLTELQREIALAEIMHSGGDVRGAVARLQAATERFSDDPAAWLALAVASSAAGDPRTAGEAAIRGLLIDEASAALQSIVMAASIEDAAWAESAILRPDRAGRLPAVLVEGVRLLRESGAASGRIAPDAAQLRAARELCSRFGDSINAWRLAAAMHLAAGQPAESKSIADAAARRFPDAPDPVEWQVVAASSLGDLEQASSLCIEWRRLSFPDVRGVDEAQAAIELTRNRPDAALPLLMRHRDLIVNDAAMRPGPYRALIASLLMTGKVREAADLERTNLETSDASRGTWAQIAAMAPYERGLEAMSILEAASPSDPVSRAQLVGKWVAFHERHPNGRALERARSLLPRSMPQPKDSSSRLAIVARADIERVAGDFAAARATLQSVIDSYPANIQDRAKLVGSLSGTDQQALFQEIEPLLYARNNLAMLLVEEDRSLDQALALVEQCIEIIPGNPDLRDTEAQVLLKLGRLSEAEQSSVMAIRAYPQNPSVLLTGAEILAASGRMEDAKQVLQRIRDIVAQEPWPSRQVENRLRRVTQVVDSQR